MIYLREKIVLFRCWYWFHWANFINYNLYQRMIIILFYYLLRKDDMCAVRCETIDRFPCQITKYRSLLDILFAVLYKKKEKRNIKRNHNIFVPISSAIQLLTNDQFFFMTLIRFQQIHWLLLCGVYTWRIWINITRTHSRFRIGFHKSFAYDCNEEACACAIINWIKEAKN